MSELKEFDLLQDLAKLLSKHGPDAFEDLAQLFEKPEFVENFRQILLVGARTARQSGVKQARSRSPKPSLHDFRLSLLDRDQLGDEKSELLVRLYDDLMAKKLFPTMRELRTFAESLGVPVPKAPGRPKAIVDVIDGLRQRSLEELRSTISRLPAVTEATDRSLANWAKIIFDTDLRSRKAE